MDTHNYIPDSFLLFTKQLCPEFVIDDDNWNIVINLYAYFMRDSHCSFNLKKGLWLEGSLGTGKSTLLYIFSNLMIQYHHGFLVYPCSDIAMQYAVNGDLDKYTYGINSYNSHPVNMGFDDLGREQIPVYYYKNELNVMQYILSTRYTLWQKQQIQTYITTNSDSEDIEQLYGEFIRSRRQEMFNIIPIIGKDRRKEK